VTDGGKLTTSTTVQRELNLPMTAGAGMGGMSGVPGAELTREPFRWDQRLYALVLRMAGHPPMTGAGTGAESGHVASDNSPVDAMCEVTGGRSYAVTSSRVLHQVKNIHCRTFCLLKKFPVQVLTLIKQTLIFEMKLVLILFDIFRTLHILRHLWRSCLNVS
jgi:hypothetical protein